jgi:hypothetical protein
MAGRGILYPRDSTNLTVLKVIGKLIRHILGVSVEMYWPSIRIRKRFYGVIEKMSL